MDILKKLLIVLILLTESYQAFADEGMWIISELNARNLARMKELGFEPDYKYLYDKDSACIANAVVIFGGGCTGITVSEEGLVFTNHHCGYGSIQKLSSVEHDYLKNGFVSQNKEEELPVDGLEVRYLKEIVDITDSIIPQIADIDDETKRIKKADSISNVISNNAGSDKFVEAEVIPFYNMNKYYLVVYNVYCDVRLVFTPPSSLGKFGDETDNWMWPRHTCDFSVFRVYADGDNQPAEYSADNQPYKPRFVAEISTQGYKEKDFAMTIGFPGSTDRYLSSWGVDRRINDINAPRIEVRGIKQEIWKKAMLADDAVRIKYASKYAGSSNYWKNSIGMNRGLANLNVIERKRQEEKLFDEWAQKPENKDIYGNVLKDIKESNENTNAKRKDLTYLSEAFYGGAEIINLARNFSHIANKNITNEEIEDVMEVVIRPFFKDYEQQLDKDLLAAMMRIVKEKVSTENLPDIYAEIDKKYKGNYEQYAADLFSKTFVLSKNQMIELLKNEKKYNKVTKKDPAIQLAQSIDMTLIELAQDINLESPKLEKGERLYFAGLQKMYPDSLMYSDANFTMRVSYGSIGGYKPFDAATYNYYTTEKGILEKEDPTSDEFWVQDDILDLIRKKDFGSYADKNDKLRLCFLSNNDITGGNSGSPVFNKNGRVIGLAFDGNWEAMSGDIAFEPELQRTISVDIRFVLWAIEKWGKCSRIIEELKLVR